MKKHFSKKLVSILLALGMLLSMTPITWAAGSTDREANAYKAEPTGAGIGAYSITNDIPSAKDVGHVHNSEGWTCYLTCDKEEHTHTIDGGCYTLVCDKEENK